MDKGKIKSIYKNAIKANLLLTNYVTNKEVTPSIWFKQDDKDIIDEICKELSSNGIIEDYFMDECIDENDSGEWISQLNFY